MTLVSKLKTRVFSDSKTKTYIIRQLPIDNSEHIVETLIKLHRSLSRDRLTAAQLEVQLTRITQIIQLMLYADFSLHFMVIHQSDLFDEYRLQLATLGDFHEHNSRSNPPSFL